MNGKTFAGLVSGGEYSIGLSAKEVSTLTGTETFAVNVSDVAANAATEVTRDLTVDTTGPTITAVATSGTGITSGAGNLNAGDAVTITLTASAATTISGGTPTLSVSGGGEANYCAGSGSTS